MLTEEEIRERSRLRSHRYRLLHGEEIRIRRREKDAARRAWEDAHPEIYGVRRRAPRFERENHSVDDVSAAWAAGFLEGEGSFMQWQGRARIKATQVDREPLERLQALFGGPICKEGGPSRATNPRRQEAWYWAVSGERALYVIETVERHMSAKRKEQIAKAKGSDD